MKMSLVVEAALAGLFAASAVIPASAQDAAAPAAPAAGGDMPQTAPAPATPAKKAPSKVHCYGVNTCKGKSECAVGDKSSCKGKNDCKGQGWISLSKRSCKHKKGSLTAPKAASATPAPAAAPDAAPASK